MTLEQVIAFEKVQSQIEGLHIEVSSLSKKSQNDALNKFKLKFINQTIAEANSLLGNGYKPFKDFEQFDEQLIPSNSDAALMLNQYLACLENLRADNIIYEEYSYKWFWVINKKTSNVETFAPRKIKNR